MLVMTGISDENTCISGVMICGTSGTSRAITSLIADAIAVSVWPMAESGQQWFDDLRDDTYQLLEDRADRVDDGFQRPDE